MNGLAQKFLLGVLTVLALAITGCDQNYAGDEASEEKEPYYMEGRSRVKAMDFNGAIESFQQAIESNPRSAAAHKELGMLFGRKGGDPASAIYHYQRYLKLRPKAHDAELVQEQIDVAKSELARGVTLGPINEQVQKQLEQLINENKRLRETNQILGQEAMGWRIHVLRLTGSTNLPPGAAQAQSPAPERRPNTASAGDTSGRKSAPATATPSSRQSGAARPVTPATRWAPASTARPTTSSQGYRPPVYPRTTYASRTHVVRKGETATSIAKRYGIRLSSLSAANPTVDVNRVRAGQVLNIP